ALIDDNHIERSNARTKLQCQLFDRIENRGTAFALRDPLHDPLERKVVEALQSVFVDGRLVEKTWPEALNRPNQIGRSQCVAIRNEIARRIAVRTDAAGCRLRIRIDFFEIRAGFTHFECVNRSVFLLVVYDESKTLSQQRL